MGLEELALQYAKDAFRNAVIGVKVLGCPSSTLLSRFRETVTFVACGDVQKRAQRVVYTLFVSTSCRYNVVELCAACQSSGGVVAAQNSLTIPELLLILEIVRHVKCHTVFAGQPPKPLSLTVQALEVIVRGAKRWRCLIAHSNAQAAASPE